MNVVLGYFLQYIPLLGLVLACPYIGFCQATCEAGAVRQSGKKFCTPMMKVAIYAALWVREIIQLHMSNLVLDEHKDSMVVRVVKGTKRWGIPLNLNARKAILYYLRMRADSESD